MVARCWVKQGEPIGSTETWLVLETKTLVATLPYLDIFHSICQVVFKMTFIDMRLCHLKKVWTMDNGIKEIGIWEQHHVCSKNGSSRKWIGISLPTSMDHSAVKRKKIIPEQRKWLMEGGLCIYFRDSRYCATACQMSLHVFCIKYRSICFKKIKGSGRIRKIHWDNLRPVH
jgi:hypothetical protein